MKIIITIQHTQSVHHTNGMVGSWTDWELTEKGIEQAKRIGAKQTTEQVGKALNLTPKLRTELRERNLGKGCGKSV